MNWWSVHYNRPLKDPLLQQYTLEELAYEYFLVKHMEIVRKENIDKEADKIEEEKWKAAEAWADEMEAMEEVDEESPAQSDPTDPMSDPNNREWVEKHMQDAKEQYGEDFGEDINLSFDEE